MQEASFNPLGLLENVSLLKAHLLSISSLKMITESNFLLIVPDVHALNIAEEICWVSVFLKSYPPPSTHVCKAYFADASLWKKDR